MVKTTAAPTSEMTAEEFWEEPTKISPPKIDTHLHFIVQSYQSQDHDGTLHDVTTVEIFADHSDAALRRAKQLVPGKKGYRVAQVIEHFGLNYCVHQH